MEYPGQTPISSDYWQIGDALTRRVESTRTLTMLFERPASKAGVANIKVGGTVQSRIWYMRTSSQGPETIWVQDAELLWSDGEPPADRGDGGKPGSDSAMMSAV